MADEPIVAKAEMLIRSPNPHLRIPTCACSTLAVARLSPIPVDQVNRRKNHPFTSSLATRYPTVIPSRSRTNRGGRATNPKSAPSGA